MSASGPFLTAEWRDLAMVNYEIDPAVLRPFVPAGTDDCDVASFYDATFAPFVCGRPSSAFIADGSPIVVRRGVRLAESGAIRGCAKRTHFQGARA